MPQHGSIMFSLRSWIAPLYSTPIADKGVFQMPPFFLKLATALPNQEPTTELTLMSLLQQH